MSTIRYEIEPHAAIDLASELHNAAIEVLAARAKGLPEKSVHTAGYAAQVNLTGETVAIKFRVGAC